MKKATSFQERPARATRKILAAIFCLASISCNDLLQNEKESSKGELRIRFDENLGQMTKSVLNIPDTNSFILLVQDSAGKTLYEGSYGAAPTSFLATAGSYSVSVRSMDFTEPLFDAPQYGDNQVVTVSAGKTASVTLSCYQTNAGIRLSIDPAFPEQYPGTQLYLKGADGRLMYSYTEKRIAYFKPGTVTLTMEGATQKTLFTRSLAAQQVLHVHLSSSESSSGNGGSSSQSPGIRISVDTSRYWISEKFEIGGTNPGSGQTTAYSVAQARELSGAEDVWVYGYIVGGDLSSSKCSFEAPFVSRTNLVLASKSSCKDKELCLSVQLAKGDIRDALNLVDHEELLGRQVFLKGDIVPSYYGIPGMQSLSEYELR